MNSYRFPYHILKVYNFWRNEEIYNIWMHPSFNLENYDLLSKCNRWKYSEFKCNIPTVLNQKTFCACDVFDEWTMWFCTFMIVLMHEKVSVCMNEPINLI